MSGQRPLSDNPPPPPRGYPPPPQPGYPPPPAGNIGQPSQQGPTASGPGGSIPPPADPGSRDQGHGADRGGVVAGIIVAGIGVLLLAGQFVPDMGRWMPLILGVVFLAVALARREYGFLIPGSILAGVGVGVLLTGVVSSDLEGAAVVLSLAAGFLAIWVLGTLLRLPQNHWWPLIPGGILAIIGMFQLADADVSGVIRLWPLILVLAGVLIIGQAFSRRRG